MAAILRTLIVDDEPLAAERLQILCARIAELEVVGTASDGAAALRLIPELHPDLLLLDIAMPELDGMQLVRALAQLPIQPAIVFVTAFAEFAVAAFEIAATDYLLKPVSQDRLRLAVTRVQDRGAASPPAEATSPWIEEFWVPHRSEIVRLSANEIDLIEAERDYMRLHVGTRSFLVHKTITELERQLDPSRFIRLHRSTIVAHDHIAGFSHNGEGIWDVNLRGGRSVRVGRSYLARARSLLGK